ncbi:hypothetical protein HBI13_196540 [Parastagonospora nodorum]|nr:hypothetical protein HBI13_196540 [Parastagonospora nodorum]KAH4024803.1 hypothetical protein HBI09_158630 [Parastagonospora nodorum]KAH5175565.1 hypothetical protein HBH68_191420 [Parastagonospora nodorum]KAH5406004.1 hypothetical protein HBI32_158920 [Parastagonospora nodorum]KAH5446114.1 hypothetical protein HBI30_189420 [Parastagonospora nodorum]
MTLVTVFWCPQTRHQSDSSVSSNLLRGCPCSPHRRTMMHGPTAPVTILTCTLAFASNLAGHEPHVVCEAVIAAHRQEVVHTESFIFANVITIPQDKLI